jgi:hypothetical protein
LDAANVWLGIFSGYITTLQDGLASLAGRVTTLEYNRPLVAVQVIIDGTLGPAEYNGDGIQGSIGTYKGSGQLMLVLNDNIKNLEMLCSVNACDFTEYIMAATYTSIFFSAHKENDPDTAKPCIFIDFYVYDTTDPTWKHGDIRSLEGTVINVFAFAVQDSVV